MKLPKPKKESLSKLKKKVWSVFSQYIRLKYADKNGMVKCYTCDTVKNWKEMQAGHGIGGRNNAVLFEERLVRPQDVGCNIFARGRYAVFTRKLIEELGLEEYDHLVSLSNKTVKISIRQLESMLEFYKVMIKEIT